MSTTQANAANIHLLALDVDGVLTDGRIYYGDNGEELKAFDIKDGLGIKLLQAAGVRIAIITGRQSEIVARRAGELGITDIIQGREDKKTALMELCERYAIPLQDCAYMGDDLPDLAAIAVAGLGMTVADACDTVRDAANWRSRREGGCGAVREACEFILSARGQLSTAVEKFR